MPACETPLIDEYLLALRGRLRGPARLRDDLLAEARDGLSDAAEGYWDAGLPAEDAQRQAVTEFGAVSRIARAYQAEIAARSARTLAIRTLGFALVLLTCGDLVWRGSSWSAGASPPYGYHLVSRGTDWLWSATAVLALASAAGLSRAARRPEAGPPWLSRAAGYGLTAALAVSMVYGMVLWTWSVLLWPAALSWPPMIVGALALTTGYGWLAGGVRGCLLATR